MNVKLISPEEKEIDAKKLLALNDALYPLKPFDELTLSFFDALSKKILSNVSVNRLPEMAALGFWLRKNNLLKIKEENRHLFESRIYRISPLGKVFHICPANVDTMFIYSLVVAVLMGNKNILRISNRMNAPQIKVLFETLNSLLADPKFEILSGYINIISYDHNEEISTFLSKQSNARVIWGGDNTINTFKAFSTAPRTKDIVFADRISVLLIDCNAYLQLTENELAEFCKNFYNDAYTFDQMGCSSPQTLYLVGEQKAYTQTMHKLKEQLSDYIISKYNTDLSSLASLKMNRLVDDVLGHSIYTKSGNTAITFAELEETNSKNLLHSCGGGYFYVKRIEKIDELAFLNQPKVQTVSYFGLKDSDKKKLIALANGEGIDRIVSLGQALSFYYIWDGYNLLDELTRKVFICR